MGKIETQISGDLTIRKVIGNLTIDELMNDVKEFYAGQPTKLVLLDLSAGSIATLTAEELRSVARFIQDHANVQIGGKTAIVAPDDLNYGVARMYVAFSEFRSLPFPVHLFRKLSDALDCLRKHVSVTS